MFPIRDINPARKTPWVTWTLIAVTSAAWLVAWASGPETLHAFIDAFGVTPAELVPLRTPWALLTPLSSLFIHASWMHVLGNVWFLHVFGDNVEDHLGKPRYLTLYVLSGLAAVAAHLALEPHGHVPLVGASGAIAGVLGAYMMRFPRAPILTWVVFGVIEVPALTFLVVWFGWQLGMMLLSAIDVGRGGVAFAAHTGGFVAGVLLEQALAPRPTPSARG